VGFTILRYRLSETLRPRGGFGEVGGVGEDVGRGAFGEAGGRREEFGVRGFQTFDRKSGGTCLVCLSTVHSHTPGPCPQVCPRRAKELKPLARAPATLGLQPHRIATRIIVSDSTDITPAAVSPRRVPVTAERAQIFLETLKKTGSYYGAAAAASPHLVRRGSQHCSVGAFREYARRNPEFAQEVEAAMGEVRGRMEALVLERALNPDERPIFHPKTGNLLGIAKDSRPANQMLSLWLASHDPGKWAPKTHVKSDVTVTNTNSDLTSGAHYIIKSDEILLLDDSERVQLIALLEKIEHGREDNAGALPEPKRPYKQGWGPDVPALPAADSTPDDTDGTPEDTDNGRQPQDATSGD
jgi:hypothetical protein